MGSLSGSDLDDLEDLGLLPSEALEGVKAEKEKGSGDANVREAAAPTEGVPWFETMVSGSRLGNIKRSWGQTVAADGRNKVEWEISEWTSDGEGEETSGTAKRKLDQVVKDDSVMDGLH